MVQGNQYFSLKFIMWFCNNAELRNKWSFSSVSLIFVIFTFVTCYMLIYICCLSSVWPIFFPPRGEETAWACTAPLCAGPSVLRNLTPCLVGINLQILFEGGFGLTVSSFPASKTTSLKRAGFGLHCAVPAWPRFVWHIKTISLWQWGTDVLIWSEIACTSLPLPQSQ